MELKKSAQRVQDVLKQHSLTTNVIEFAETTRTSQEAAQAIGCQVGQIAKTLIFMGKTSKQPICIIASGSNRVDEKKVKNLLGEAITKPDAAFVLEHTTFVIGGVPPIGYSLTIKPLIDEDLLQYAEVWAAAGTPFSVFKITPEDLVAITDGQVVDIKK
jgi:prolyl-tRNA editing enzyme YbaK/EbsC (Cys-tRNA(Pro) deacylase)